MEDLDKAIDDYLKKGEKILNNNQKVFENKVKYLNKSLKEKKGDRAREFELFINKKIINVRKN